jgi:hypothetical protein
MLLPSKSFIGRIPVVFILTTFILIFYVNACNLQYTKRRPTKNIQIFAYTANILLSLIIVLAIIYTYYEIECINSGTFNIILVFLLLQLIMSFISIHKTFKKRDISYLSVIFPMFQTFFFIIFIICYVYFNNSTCFYECFSLRLDNRYWNIDNTRGINLFKKNSGQPTEQYFYIGDLPGGVVN